MALLLPPLARRQLGRAPFDLPRNRERRAPHLVESPARLEAHVDVDAARARRLRPAAQSVLVEHVSHDERDVAHVFPGRARAGVEVDAQLVGMIEVVGTHGVRVQVDAAEVDDPEELRGVAYDDLDAPFDPTGSAARPSRSSPDDGSGARFWKNGS